MRLGQAPLTKDWWDSAGLVAMLVASVALIVVGVVGAS